MSHPGPQQLSKPRPPLGTTRLERRLYNVLFAQTASRLVSTYTKTGKRHRSSAVKHARPSGCPASNGFCTASCMDWISFSAEVERSNSQLEAPAARAFLAAQPQTASAQRAARCTCSDDHNDCSASG